MAPARPPAPRRKAAAAAAYSLLAFALSAAAAASTVAAHCPGLHAVRRQLQADRRQLQQQQQVEPTSTTLKCEDGFQVGDRKYNFAEIGKRTYDVVSSDGITNFHYAIRLCDKLENPENDNCKSARICRDSRTYKGGSPSSSFTQLAGDEFPTVTLSGAQGSEHPNVTLSFTQIDKLPRPSIILRCNPTVDDGASRPVLESADEKSVVFTLESKSACGEVVDKNPSPPPKDPQNPPPSEPAPAPPPELPSKPPGGSPEAQPEKKGMSALAVIFLVLIIGVAVYFAAGIYYNHKVYGAHGWDLIPHSDFWRELPSLVSDVLRHVYNSLFNRNSAGYTSVA